MAIDPFLFQAMTNRYYAQSVENVQRGLIYGSLSLSRDPANVPSLVKRIKSRRKIRSWKRTKSRMKIKSKNYPGVGPQSCSYSCS